jgi:hypothetical protein
MKQPASRAILTLLFNGAAVLLLLRGGWNAFRARDFIPMALLMIFAALYSVGFFMQATEHRVARAANIRMQVAGVYLFTALMTFVSVDDLMYMANASGQPYQGVWHAILVLSSLGSLTLAIACISALIKPRYGHIVATLGVSLSWPYFAYLAWNLPWNDFGWLITIHWDGALNVLAVLSLFISTVCSIASLAIRSTRITNATPKSA